LPDLELGLLLEQADQDRRLHIHVLVGDGLQQFWRDRLIGLGVGGERNLVGVAAGHQHTGSGERNRGDKRANQRATNQARSSTPSGSVRHPHKSTANALKPLSKILSLNPVSGNRTGAPQQRARTAWSTKVKSPLTAELRRNWGRCSFQFRMWRGGVGRGQGLGGKGKGLGGKGLMRGGLERPRCAPSRLRGRAGVGVSPRFAPPEWREPPPAAPFERGDLPRERER